MSRMKHGAAWGAAVLLLWAGAAAAQNAADTLPPGPGHDEFLLGCNACHDLSTVTSRRYDPDHWKAMVDNMVGRGAPLNAAQAAAVTDYLVRNFAAPPEAPIPIAPH
jgi:competence protein ComEA